MAAGRRSRRRAGSAAARRGRSTGGGRERPLTMTRAAGCRWPATRPSVPRRGSCDERQAAAFELRRRRCRRARAAPDRGCRRSRSSACLPSSAIEPQPVGVEQRRRALVAVEAVAERDDAFGAGAPRDRRSSRFSVSAGVVGRQQLAASGEGRELFEMQVGDQQRRSAARTARPRAAARSVAGEAQEHGRLFTSPCGGCRVAAECHALTSPQRLPASIRRRRRPWRFRGPRRRPGLCRCRAAPVPQAARFGRAACGRCVSGCGASMPPSRSMSSRPRAASRRVAWIRM